MTAILPLCTLCVLYITHMHCYIDIQSDYVVCEWSYLLDLYHQGHRTSIDKEEVENKSFTEFMLCIDVLVT